LLGTSSGQLGPEEETLGQSCRIAGLTANGYDLYAVCSRSRAGVALSLIKVDIIAGSVQAGLFTEENAQDDAGNSVRFSVAGFMANGMAVDAQGRVYISNSLGFFSRRPLYQVIIDDSLSQGNQLSFIHRTWLRKLDIMPNGLQIDSNNQLFYVNGFGINKVEINEDGSAGESSPFFRTFLAPLDDFAFLPNGGLVIAQIFPTGIIYTNPADEEGRATREKFQRLNYSPSSTALAPAQLIRADSSDDNTAEGRSVIVTTFFSGGLDLITD